MEELSSEARALYELLKADTAEEYEKRFIDYKKEVLDAFHPFVVDTRAQLKSVDSGMAALSSDIQGVKVQIGQDLDAVRTTLSTEVANLTAASRVFHATTRLLWHEIRPHRKLASRTEPTPAPMGTAGLTTAGGRQREPPCLLREEVQIFSPLLMDLLRSTVTNF